jgi:hypothetical protein
MNARTLGMLALLALFLVLAGCAAPTASVTAGGNQAELRQMQTREYQQLDRRSAMRSVIATLQDLGFVVDRAEYELGLMTATRFEERSGPRADKHIVRVTVTVTERPGQRLSVRANARYGERAVEDPKAYQDFFAALDKSLFLTANRVD